MVYRYEKTQSIMLLSPRCTARSDRSRAMIILVGQRVIVGLGLPHLGSCATHVFPEPGEKERRKTPWLRSSEAPTRSIHTLVRDNSRSFRRSSPPSMGFFLPSRQGGEHHSHKWLPYVAPPAAHVLPRSVTICFRHRLIRKMPPVPSAYGLRCPGAAYIGGVLLR
jgi:hypothetical protein